MHATRQLRRRWAGLLRATGTQGHTQHVLATVLLYQLLARRFAGHPDYLAHHRQLLLRAITYLERHHAIQKK
jgi:hypothetical protein